jgi:hypothetical protein
VYDIGASKSSNSSKLDGRHGVPFSRRPIKSPSVTEHFSSPVKMFKEKVASFFLSIYARLGRLSESFDYKK